MNSLLIGEKNYGPTAELLLIAEVGLAHEGSLGSAHAYIDAAADCNVTAVKFQTHIAEEESTHAEKFRVNVFPQDSTRFEYWRRTSFSLSQWKELASHANERGLLFLSSPFSNLAVDWLIECGVPAWKVASGEITNLPMVSKMADTGLPLLVSSGMSSWPELNTIVDLIKPRGVPFGIFQCTTSYPCPPDKWGLNVLGELEQRFNCPVGLSDHSGEIFACLAAVALGATMLEFHIAFSKQQFGPDAKASLDLVQTKELVRGVMQIQNALKNPINKDEQAKELAHLHRLFTKSVVSARNLEAGRLIQTSDLAVKKPGTGIPASAISSIVGRRLARAVPRDHFFAEVDFE
jgi:N,N'-diacetyllegionaminate synthase